jgi:hypothetical protein
MTPVFIKVYWNRSQPGPTSPLEQDQPSLSEQAEPSPSLASTHARIRSRNLEVHLVPDPAFGLKFRVDFTKEALAAIAGAGVGAWLGARFAFGLERRKAPEDRKAAATGASAELASRRATAGNLAMFTLSQIHNDLLLYDLQLLQPAKISPALWFYLVPTGVAESNFYRFDVPSLAFLLESKYPGAPEMLSRLALEEDRHATILRTAYSRTSTCSAKSGPESMSIFVTISPTSSMRPKSAPSSCRNDPVPAC